LLFGPPGTTLQVMVYTVFRQWGPAWDRSRPLREQQAFVEHAEFMDELVDEGFVVLGGPLRDGALLIIEADGEEAVRARLEEDPWSPMEMLRTATVDRWEILLGDLATR
jgi:uncharacterized protein YciI